MGIHIYVDIYSYLDSGDLILQKEKYYAKGKIEDDYNYTITADNSGESYPNNNSVGNGHQPHAFCGKANSHSDPARGYVTYELPNKINMNIVYFGDTYQEEYEPRVYENFVFVELESQSGNLGQDQYFVVVENSTLYSESNDDLTVRVNVYSRDAAVHRDLKDNLQHVANTPTTQVHVNNTLGSWLTLKKYEGPRELNNDSVEGPKQSTPPMVLNGTSSVGPGQTLIVNCCPEYTNKPDVYLTYNISNDLTCQIIPKGYQKKPECTFSSNAGYMATISPDEDGHNDYTVTVEQQIASDVLHEPEQAIADT
ncbi:hypothetical protein [Pseudovibrio brasiliensis]|uniref:Uncharacterized protein n=1 Tax=Pseudovibrio brasiliensis TaxID=1898042 RepID=A0ABX8AY69_9HYPH|nr:hypothetical protein [Pseudovibrio brasiliensis]QUS59132.1 hypothetical protein KGB56_26805 [Pseudovibrio brasiliensis]